MRVSERVISDYNDSSASFPKLPSHIFKGSDLYRMKLLLLCLYSKIVLPLIYLYREMCVKNPECPLVLTHTVKKAPFVTVCCCLELDCLGCVCV